MNHQNEAAINALELEMIEALRPCESALEMNGPGSLMLTMELAVLGKPMEAITLGEFRAAYERVVKQCNGR